MARVNRCHEWKDKEYIALLVGYTKEPFSVATAWYISELNKVDIFPVQINHFVFTNNKEGTKLGHINWFKFSGNLNYHFLFFNGFHCILTFMS